VRLAIDVDRSQVICWRSWLVTHSVYHMQDTATKYFVHTCKNSIYLNAVIPHSRVLLEKLTVPQLVSKLPQPDDPSKHSLEFYHGFLSWNELIHFTLSRPNFFYDSLFKSSYNVGLPHLSDPSTSFSIRVLQILSFFFFCKIRIVLT
jgi:hypothetical protein